MAAFYDAQARKAEHPGSFHAPDLDELSLICVGDSVKVGVDGEPGERFWVSVTDVTSGMIFGTVDNDLVCTDQHGLSFGDAVCFSVRCVCNILGAKVRS